MNVWLNRALRATASLVALFIVGSIPVSVPGGDDIAVPATKQPIAASPSTAAMSQQFPATGRAIHSVDLALEMSHVADRGVVQVSIATERDGNWQVLNQSHIGVQEVIDGHATVRFIPPLTVAAGQLLRLTVQPDSDAAPAFAWLMNPDYHADGFALSVNGTPQMGAARFGVTYERQHGRLAQLSIPVYQRITVLLNGFWRGVLLLAGGALLVALLVVPWRSPHVSADVPPVDRDPDTAILQRIETDGASTHHSGQEGQG